MASFKGADDQEYQLRLSFAALRRFEKHTGKRLLKTVFGSVRAMAQKSEDELTDSVLDGLGQLFESLDDAGRLVYEASVPRNAQAEMDFEKFCEDVLVGDAIRDAVQAVFSAIVEHMGASADAVAQTGVSGSDPKKAGE